MNIVFASHTYLSPVFVVGSHHLARAAARAMHRVWHVSAAFSLLHLPLAIKSADHRRRFALARSTARLVEPRLWESVPLTYLPWVLTKRQAHPEAGYLKGPRTLKRSAAQLGFDAPDLLLIDEPRMAHLVPLLRPRIAVYRPTDVYSVHKSDPSLVALERRLLKCVHGVVGTSAPVLEHVRALGSELPTLLLENGVDLGHFVDDRVEPEELKSLPHPRAVYVGAVDHRFGAELLHAAASQNPDTTFIVIGGGEPKTASVMRPENVRYLGPRPYEQIPAYLQHCDFAVMPLSGATSNSGRSPMKMFEFAAAGLPVVATDTEELRRRRLPFVQLVRSAEEFGSACQRVAELDDQELSDTARRVADSHGWDAKLAQLLEFVRSL